MTSQQILTWAKQLGFNSVGISDIDLRQHEAYLNKWLAHQHHGEMAYMADHGTKRSRPDELLPGTIRVISVRMDYLPKEFELKTVKKQLNTPTDKGCISLYAQGRDYHKLIRKRLVKLAQKIEAELGQMQYRTFADSAPVLERALAEKAGLGFIGKNACVIDPNAGSFFFLGEIYTNIPLPINKKAIPEQCGPCQACLKICPTNAIIAPYQIDAKRCISYLTIELKGSIPVEFRPLIGNRIYGCDDCQLICPWNRYAKLTQEKDFLTRPVFESTDLTTLFAWDETTFLKNTEGSAIRRIGHERWLRNIAVALGNAPSSEKVINALKSRLNNTSSLVQEHIAWALLQHVS